MNRTQKLRLDRLEQAADMRGDTIPQSGVLTFDETLLFEQHGAGLCTLEEFLAGMNSTLTVDLILYAESLVTEANGTRPSTAEDFGIIR